MSYADQATDFVRPVQCHEQTDHEFTCREKANDPAEGRVIYLYQCEVCGICQKLISRKAGRVTAGATWIDAPKKHRSYATRKWMEGNE